MKTTIAIEDGKITISVDDQKPVELSVPATPPVITAPEPKPSISSKEAIRQCEECGKDFEPLRVDSRFCSKSCGQKSYMRRNRSRYAMPKSPEKPAAAISDEDREQNEKIIAEQHANFTDLWNCGMCRNAGDLCTMHESMTRDGKRPPKIEKVPQGGER